MRINYEAHLIALPTRCQSAALRHNMEKQKRPHRDSSESSYSEASNNDEEATTHGKAKKRATVYDAVAGKNPQALNGNLLL